MPASPRRRAPSPSGARIFSFAPVVAPDAQRLILGSMPGVASLSAHQYYAHPHNQFWRIMGALCGADTILPYAARLSALQAHGIALWDVLHSCVREGSLDAAIEHADAAPNDLPTLLRGHAQIRRICCNGAVAYQSQQRHFGEPLSAAFPQIEVLRLPSTSAANASWTLQRKLQAWRAALQR